MLSALRRADASTACIATFTRRGSERAAVRCAHGGARCARCRCRARRRRTRAPCEAPCPPHGGSPSRRGRHLWHLGRGQHPLQPRAYGRGTRSSCTGRGGRFSWRRRGVAKRSRWAAGAAPHSLERGWRPCTAVRPSLGRSSAVSAACATCGSGLLSAASGGRRHSDGMRGGAGERPRRHPWPHTAALRAHVRAHAHLPAARRSASRTHTHTRTHSPASDRSGWPPPVRSVPSPHPPGCPHHCLAQGGCRPHVRAHQPRPHALPRACARRVLVALAPLRGTAGAPMPPQRAMASDASHVHRSSGRPPFALHAAPARTGARMHGHRRGNAHPRTHTTAPHIHPDASAPANAAARLHASLDRLVPRVGGPFGTERFAVQPSHRFQ